MEKDFSDFVIEGRGLMAKTCTKCGMEKPLSEFYPDGKRLRADCKACNKASRKLWREANPEQVKETCRRYYDQNREECLIKVREYRIKNADLIRERRHNNRENNALRWQEYYTKNRERYLAHRREYAKEHKERITRRKRELASLYPGRTSEYCKRWSKKYPAKVRIKSQRRRAMKKSLPAYLTGQQWEWLLEQSDHRCVYCGKHETEVGKLHQDHVVPISQGGAYTVSNIVPACQKCNLEKGGKTPVDANMPIAIYINALASMEQMGLEL